MDVLQEPSTPVAVLTSLTPSERWHEEQLLKCLSQQNVANLSLVRDALFVVALDPDDSPRTAYEAMFALHSGNFVNQRKISNVSSTEALKALFFMASFRWSQTC